MPVSAAYAEIIKRLMEDLGLKEVVGSLTDRAVSYAMAGLARPMFIRMVINALRSGEAAPRFDGENYVSPSEALGITGDMLVEAAKLAVISPELGEIVSEGLSEELINALQHVTTEPLERLFALKLGAENLDSDDVSEAYAWGLMRPDMLAYLAAVDGLSNTSAQALFIKALGEEYSGDFRAIEDYAAMVAAKAWTVEMDWLDKLYSEARSALWGLPEAVRTQYNEYVSEVNRLYTAALRKALDSLIYARAASRVDDAKTQARLQAQAAVRLAEAEAALEVAELLAEELARFEAALSIHVRDVASEAARTYNEVRDRYAAVLADMAAAAAELSRRTQGDVYAEYREMLKALSLIRGQALEAPPPPSDVADTEERVEGLEAKPVYVK